MTTDICSEDVIVQMAPQVAMTSEGAGAGGGVARGGSGGALELGRRLLLAARAGDTALVLDLMAKGAPFTADWLGTSPLHLAAGHDHAATCGVLLRAGVSRDSRTKSTPPEPASVELRGRPDTRLRSHIEDHHIFILKVFKFEGLDDIGIQITTVDYITKKSFDALQQNYAAPD
ncbi:unnamed protein product [Diatraea saccharalis]|uniref:Uncharacterized protein n=1 Tax=Diatraea saccharalis TaxID=40085 RepID=A0A9N9RD84_9NEOP|nr:unnamed protein product [Diatraea saccharalis]